jgi:nitrite reductase (NADH) small subunit
MTWHQVALAEDIQDGKVLIVQEGKREIGIFNIDGQWFAVLNVCPHAQAPICRGKVDVPLFASACGEYHLRTDRKVLRCPWHHWEFELDTGHAVSNVKQRLKTYPVQVKDGYIMIDF